MKAILALLLCFHAGMAAASGVFDQPATPEALIKALGPVVTELRNAQTLRGSYTQRKFLPELPKPLVAEGSFLFVRDRGIVWRTLKPFPSELIITRDALIQRQGGQTLRIAAEQQPAIQMVGRIFFAVFSLDLSALDALFKLYGVGGNPWQLGLKPRQTEITLREVEIRGSAQVEHVLMRESGGDLTEICIRDTLASTQPPSATDLAAFKP